MSENLIYLPKEILIIYRINRIINKAEVKEFTTKMKLGINKMNIDQLSAHPKTKS